MRRSILFALMFTLALAAPSWADPQKNKGKVKEKRFEPVVKSEARDYAGRYVGIDDSYVLEVGTHEDGTLKITSVEGARRARLTELKLDGARVTAKKVYEDGTTAEFEGLFCERILNGERAFGVLVSGLDIRLDGLTINRTFYRLFTAAQ